MRKKIYYVDMSAIESGKDLCPFETLVRHNLLTTQDWDRLFTWMDIELALEALSDYERRCLVSSLIEGYTQEEIAARLHVSQEAVMKQIKKAKRKMRNILAEGYKTPPKCTHK
jgi:RNA polymerase sigma factor (sigma-70 family)